MFYPILIHSRHSEPPQGSFGGHDGFISQPLTRAALKRGNPTFLGQIPNDHAVTELEVLAPAVFRWQEDSDSFRAHANFRGRFAGQFAIGLDVDAGAVGA